MDINNRCGCMTKSGKQCSFNKLPNRKYCRLHTPCKKKATQTSPSPKRQCDCMVKRRQCLRSSLAPEEEMCYQHKVKCLRKMGLVSPTVVGEQDTFGGIYNVIPPAAGELYNSPPVVQGDTIVKYEDVHKFLPKPQVQVGEQNFLVPEQRLNSVSNLKNQLSQYFPASGQNQVKKEPEQDKRFPKGEIIELIDNRVKPVEKKEPEFTLPEFAKLDDQVFPPINLNIKIQDLLQDGKIDIPYTNKIRGKIGTKKEILPDIDIYTDMNANIFYLDVLSKEDFSCIRDYIEYLFKSRFENIRQVHFELSNDELVIAIVLENGIEYQIHFFFPKALKVELVQTLLVINDV